jgi:CRISPR-associated endonuclease/helicase Cas3
VLGKRLAARKVTSLIEIKCRHVKQSDPPHLRHETEVENHTLLVKELASQAHRLGALHQTGVIGVVVNRVATARALFQEIISTDATDAILLTGRARPYDRDRLLERWMPRLRAGRPRNNEELRPLLVVATQCIEVGVNVDFDGMVSEATALDALRQRFGRLDRLGFLENSEAAILVRSDQLKNKDDPIYGPALAETWKWLNERISKTRKKPVRSIDFGIAGFSQLLTANGPPPVECYTPSRSAPVTLAAHIDMWVQTSPRPAVEPDVSHFLHGPDSAPADVQIIWRADLDTYQPDQWVDLVAMLPPYSREAIAVPFYAAQAWLTHAASPAVADVEGVIGAPIGTAASPWNSALRWRGPEESQIIDGRDLHPGDTIVVPCSYGGADEFGWNPDSPAPVVDIAEQVSYERGLTALRLHPTVLAQYLSQSLPQDIALALRDLMSDLGVNNEASAEAVTELLDRLSAGETLPDWMKETAALLKRDVRRRVVPYPNFRGVSVIASQRRAIASKFGVSGEGTADFTDEDDTSALTRVVTLADHSEGVSVTWKGSVQPLVYRRRFAKIWHFRRGFMMLARLTLGSKSCSGPATRWLLRSRRNRWPSRA